MPLMIALSTFRSKYFILVSSKDFDVICMCVAKGNFANKHFQYALVLLIGSDQDSSTIVALIRFYLSHKLAGFSLEKCESVFF